MSLADKIRAVPDKVKGKLEAVAQKAVAPIDRVVKDVLGVQGSETNRSKPGEPPRRQSGRLQRETTVKWTTNPIRISVVSAAPYAKWLDKNLNRPIVQPIRERVNFLVRNLIRDGLK